MGWEPGGAPVVEYAFAFVLTWLIETIVYLMAFRALGRPAPQTVGRVLLLVLGLNVATHPLLWWFTAAVPGIGPLLVAETLAVLVEGSIIGFVLRQPGRDTPARWDWRLGWGWGYLAALLANAVSLLVGLLFFAPLLRLLLPVLIEP